MVNSTLIRKQQWTSALLLISERSKFAPECAVLERFLLPSLLVVLIDTTQAIYCLSAAANDWDTNQLRVHTKYNGPTMIWTLSGENPPAQTQDFFTTSLPGTQVRVLPGYLFNYFLLLHRRIFCANVKNLDATREECNRGSPPVTPTCLCVSLHLGSRAAGLSNKICLTQSRSSLLCFRAIFG